MLSPRDVAFVGCRLMALYFLYQVLQWLPHLYSTLSSTIFVVMGEHEIELDREVSIYLPLALQFVTELAPMLFFWFGADWLSGKIWPAGGAGAGGEEGQWDRTGVLSVVIVATGAVLFLSNFSTVVLWAFFSVLGYEKSFWTLDVLEAFPRALVSVLFGSLFVLSAGTIARLIERLGRR